MGGRRWRGGGEGWDIDYWCLFLSFGELGFFVWSMLRTRLTFGDAVSEDHNFFGLGDLDIFFPFFSLLSCLS